MICAAVNQVEVFKFRFWLIVLGKSVVYKNVPAYAPPEMLVTEAGPVSFKSP